MYECKCKPGTYCVEIIIFQKNVKIMASFEQERGAGISVDHVRCFAAMDAHIAKASAEKELKEMSMVHPI